MARPKYLPEWILKLYHLMYWNIKGSVGPGTCHRCFEATSTDVGCVMGL